MGFTGLVILTAVWHAELPLAARSAAPHQIISRLAGGKLTPALLAYALVWCAFRRSDFPLVLAHYWMVCSALRTCHGFPAVLYAGMSWKHQALKALFAF